MAVIIMWDFFAMQITSYRTGLVATYRSFLPEVVQLIKNMTMTKEMKCCSVRKWDVFHEALHMLYRIVRSLWPVRDVKGDVRELLKGEDAAFAAAANSAAPRCV